MASTGTALASHACFYKKDGGVEFHGARSIIWGLESYMGIRDTKLVASTLQFPSVPNTRSCLLSFPWTQKSSAPPAYPPRLHTQKRHNSEYLSSRSARPKILL